MEQKDFQYCNVLQAGLHTHKAESLVQEVGEIMCHVAEFKSNKDEAIKNILHKYIEVSLFNNDDTEFEVFITWKCKTLQNCKWLMCTNLPDNRYYELTYSGSRAELYIDMYQKEDNVVINMYHEE